MASCGSVLLLGAALALSSGLPQPRDGRARVAIVSVDGLRPDALVPAEALNILALAQRGARALEARTVFPSITLPAHASMLSGCQPAVHGLTWNDYQAERGAIQVPTVFSLAHGAGLRTALVAGKEKLRHLDAPGTLDSFVLVTDGDGAAATAAVTEAARGFGLLFVHLPDVDLTGHAHGWMSTEYLAAVARADAAVGRILAALPRDTTVILTADHGGHGTSHGSADPADMRIPWIVAGPRIPPGLELRAPVQIEDTAATAAHVLGLVLPPSAVGRPVLEAFAAPSEAAVGR